MLIALNPGHKGQRGSGAVGYGISEQDLTPQYVNLTKKYLEEAGHTVKIVDGKHLKDICNLANLINADILVSYHFNASYFEKANGVEVLYYPKSRKGRWLAVKILRHICHDLKLRDRGIKKRRRLYILRHSKMPAVIIEAGFITNYHDNNLIKSYEGMRTICSTVSRAIRHYAEHFKI